MKKFLGLTLFTLIFLFSFKTAQALTFPIRSDCKNPLIFTSNLAPTDHQVWCNSDPIFVDTSWKPQPNEATSSITALFSMPLVSYYECDEVGNDNKPLCSTTNPWIIENLPFNQNSLTYITTRDALFGYTINYLDRDFAGDAFYNYLLPKQVMWKVETAANNSVMPIATWVIVNIWPFLIVMTVLSFTMTAIIIFFKKLTK